MNHIDRRNWLKTFALTSGFTALGGVKAFAFHESFDKGNNLSLKIAKLNSNENPYGPSEKVRKTIIEAFDIACRYPFMYLKSLVEKIAETEGVSTDHIVVTGGSTEGLKAVGLTYGLNGGELIAADPTFQSMLTYAENFGAYVHRVPVDENMQHDLMEMENRVNSKTRLIFICNPNNPTGTLLEKNALTDFCKRTSEKAMVFSDEAYYDFITEPDYPSMVALVKDGKNIIVSKTFSKVYGLAGMRIGYLVARPDIAARLRKNVMAMTNVLAIEAAKKALEDDEFYKFSVAQNIKAKTAIYKTLDDLGLPYIKSHTNFVFFKSGKHINELMPAMEKENVLIGRPFPPFYDWARISTGTMEDMEAFDKGLKIVMG